MTKAVKRRSPEEFPAHVLKIPGLLGDLYGWIESCAVRPAPILSLGASLAVLATVAGRWYETPTGLRANLYAVGLARSGAGKENGRSCAMTILRRSGLPDLCGTDDVASSAGLLRVLHAYPVRLFPLDEIGLMLSSITSHKAGTHERDILTVLMRLFSSASTSWNGKAYAEKNAEPIEQPHAVVWGTSTPDRFWGALSGGHVVDGFLNRLLVLPQDGEIPPITTPAGSANRPPEHLCAALRRIGSGEAVEQAGTIKGVVSASTRTTPYTVPQTQGAAVLLAEAAERQRERQNVSKCPEAWTRAWEQTAKLALLAAISIHPDRPTITEDCVRWAATIAWWSVARTAQAAEERVGDTDEQRAAGVILGALRRAKGRLTQRQLTRATQRLDRRHREAATRTLLDAGVIGEVHENSGGQTIKVFEIIAESDSPSPEAVTA